MPGELVQGHAKLEKECSNCHEVLHEGIAVAALPGLSQGYQQRPRAGKGLHGKRPDAIKPNCNVCHTDHKGRTADVVQLDKETFNHALTNFPLAGGHKEPACDGCHKPNVKFPGTRQINETAATRAMTSMRVGWGKLPELPQRGKLVRGPHLLLLEDQIPADGRA